MTLNGQNETAPQTILAVGAHPDDVEFMAAGTLARLRSLGYNIAIATFTPGDCGSAELPAEEIASLRRQEAKNAAALLEARYVCLEERDLAIDYTTETRRKVTALLREVNPLMVLTHPREDYMVDHEIASRLARDACFTASLPNFAAPTDAPPMEHIPYLYYWDPLEGTNYWGEPVVAEFAIDVTDVLDTKRRMLACHVSQREWLRRQHGLDQYLVSMETWSANRGGDFGFTYAEGFVQHRGHPYPSDNLLLRLLGE
jgi:LmbE family N-acetylglucosaminyl deacetylase